MTEPVVHGTVAAGFEPVRVELAEILAAEGADLGVQLAAYHHGEPVVDLWAGEEVRRDSLLGTYSVSKGLAHLVVALLVQDGLLDLDERVSHYWPEFGVAGKRDILVRELLSHQAGLIGTSSGFTTEELADDRAVAKRLEVQRPFWRPGAVSGYHALVMAALSGELVRRVSGHDVPELFAARLRDPYRLDLHFGLPAEEDHRFLPARPMVATPERLRELAATATGPNSLSGIAFNRHHPRNREVWELPNLPLIRARGPASFGAIGTAHGLAKLYAAVTNPLEGNDPLLTPEIAGAFAQIQCAGWDLVLREQKAWAVGFHPLAEVYPVLGEGAFGHSGAGGQLALVDPRNGLSYAFLRRRFAPPAQAITDHGRLLRALRQASTAR